MTARLMTPVKVLRMERKNGMFTAAVMRCPEALESCVSTFQATLFPRDPAFAASSVDWYEPVEPLLANFAARGFADGTATENEATPLPKESIWFTAPRMFAVLRSKSVLAPFAETIPSRVEV